MKRFLTASLCLSLAVLLFTACFDELTPGGSDSGEPGKLAIDLYKLTLSSSELATVGGFDLKLNVDKQPKFATRDEVEWTIEGSPKIRLDQDGNIETDPIPNGSPPESSLVKVQSVHDPSVYALCTVTIFPDYGATRYWNFGDKDWPDLPANVKAYFTTAGMTVPYNIDEDWGNGLVRRGGTGSGSYNNPAESPDGKGLENGMVPSNANAANYPPYPWVYPIDPNDPYKDGLTPTGGSRGSMTFNDTSNPNGNAANPTGRDVIPTGSGWEPGSLRSGGLGRIFSIAAIKGPFNIEVRYTSNGNDYRWVDLRFGNNFRVQGPPVMGTGSGAGAGVLSFNYENDDVVPFVYIECGLAVRFFEILINPITVDP